MAFGYLITLQSPSIAIYTRLTCNLCKIKAFTHITVWDKSETEIDFYQFLPSWWVSVTASKTEQNWDNMIESALDSALFVTWKS